MREYPRLVFERKRTLGEIVLEYGSTNPVEGSNVQPVAWCLDAWSLGADGVIPWQTVGNSDSWNQADELALFYPHPAKSGHGRSGPGEQPAPIPSIRLKSYRRGQQDVEYLTLWSQLHGRAAVGSRRSSPRGARTWPARARRRALPVVRMPGRIDYGRLRPQHLWALRVAIGEAISQAHPSPKPKLVDFRTPRRELRSKHRKLEPRDKGASPMSLTPSTMLPLGTVAPEFHLPDTDRRAHGFTR